MFFLYDKITLKKCPVNYNYLSFTIVNGVLFMALMFLVKNRFVKYTE